MFVLLHKEKNPKVSLKLMNVETFSRADKFEKIHKDEGSCLSDSPCRYRQKFMTKGKTIVCENKQQKYEVYYCQVNYHPPDRQ